MGLFGLGKGPSVQEHLHMVTVHHFGEGEKVEYQGKDSDAAKDCYSKYKVYYHVIGSRVISVSWYIDGRLYKY